MDVGHAARKKMHTGVRRMERERSEAFASYRAQWNPWRSDKITSIGTQVMRPERGQTTKKEIINRREHL